MKRKHLIASTAAAAVALTACAGVAFIDKAREFAIGTWSCEMNHLEIAVGVQSDGKVLFQHNHGDVFEFSWKLDGTRVVIGGPKNTTLEAELDITKLEDGTITHTDTTPTGQGQIIGGADGSVSAVKWDFDAKTVTLQAQGLPGVVANTMTCVKTSEDITLRVTPTTQMAPQVKSLKDLGATIENRAARTEKEGKFKGALAWQQALVELGGYVPSQAMPPALSMTFITEDGTRTRMLDGANVIAGPLAAPPVLVEMTSNDVTVCMTPSTDAKPAMILDGACATK